MEFQLESQVKTAKLAGFRVGEQPARRSWRRFGASFTSSGVALHLSAAFLMKSLTQTREAAGRRAECDD